MPGKKNYLNTNSSNASHKKCPQRLNEHHMISSNTHGNKNFKAVKAGNVKQLIPRCNKSSHNPMNTHTKKEKQLILSKLSVKVGGFFFKIIILST